ncbi:MAG: substrate-binding domain-containing protein, partial [Rectinema sp.]|nr:substrate-binding domain-containing protein [Rectinema sp.]
MGIHEKTAEKADHTGADKGCGKLDTQMRVAFLLASIHTGAAKRIWTELFRVCHRDRIILYVFPGGRLNAPESHEFMRNKIFHCIKKENFDGAVSWASTLSGYVAEKDVEAFHSSVIDIPLVTFGLKFEHAPCVHIDTYNGMKELVFHLAKKHEKRKIAYIGGPSAHSSAEARHRAYRDALKTLGLAFDPRLEVLNNSWDQGEYAAVELLDHRKLIPGKDFDALCAASDLLLFDAVQVLQRKGYVIPKDVALGGFNDSEESYLLSPTLTTVNMPFAKQASQAFKSLKRILSGHLTEDDAFLGTKLVIRQSCGCHIDSVRLVESTKRKIRFRTKLCPPNQSISSMRGIPDEDDLLHQIEQIARKKMQINAEKAGNMAEELLASFYASLSSDQRPGFLDVLDVMLNQAILEGREISAFQDIITLIHGHFRKMAGGSTTKCEEHGQEEDPKEVIIHQARILVSDAEKRKSNYQSWKERKIEHAINCFNQDLLCATDVAFLIKSAQRWLFSIGIHSCHIVMYHSEEENLYCGGYSREKLLIPEFSSGDIVPCIHFPARKILPEHLAPVKAGVHIMLPLYDRSTSIGYAVMGTEHIDPSLVEEILSLIHI